MLEFAAVGLHGRVLLLLLLAAAAGAQSTTAFDELIPELVERIAAAVPSGTQVTLTITAQDDPAQTAALQMRFAAQLAAHGVRVIEGTAPMSISAGCGRNLRERVCIAAIHGDQGDQLATITRPLDPSLVSRDGSLALELRPVLSQRTQMLDVVPIVDRLLVLDINAVTVFAQEKDGSWRAVQSHRLPLSRPWPRDARGLLRIDGGRLDIFVPGGSCTAGTDSLDVTCADRPQPWPIGVENRGIEPGRNYFRGADGAVFYNAAPFGAAAGDDAIELTSRCAPGTYVVAVSRNAADGRDVLQLSRVSDGRLAPSASPVVLGGVLTALWPQADKTSAVVITHDVAAGRYDASYAAISCSH